MHTNMTGGPSDRPLQPAREIGRETSHNLVEIRTVLSRAETALADLQETREETHNRTSDPECSPSCPGRAFSDGDDVWHGPAAHHTYPDPDYPQAKAVMEDLVRRLGKFRRTGRPPRRPRRG